MRVEPTRCCLHGRLFFDLKVSSVKYLAKPLSTFHQINAYEEGGFLVLDMCASDDGLAIANYNLQNLRQSGEALDEVSGTKGGDPPPPKEAKRAPFSYRCTTPCVGSSHGGLSCLSTWIGIQPTTRTSTPDTAALPPQ